jgi:hypothetical protein
MSDNWNFDLTTIPRGHTVKRTRIAKGKDGEPDKEVNYGVFIPHVIWALTPGGDVVESWFIPEKSKADPARWANMNSKHEPVAWHEFFKPAAPVITRFHEREAQ